MPSRHSRNARNNNRQHTTQQPTPSSRPSPDVYPSSLPVTDESAGNSSDDNAVIGRSEAVTMVNTRTKSKGRQRDYHIEERESSESPLIDISSPAPPQSLPTPPLPEFSNMPEPGSETPLSPLWDDSNTGNLSGNIHSPILSSLAGHGLNRNTNLFGDAFSRAATSVPSSPISSTTAIPKSVPPATPHLIGTHEDGAGSPASFPRMHTVNVETPFQSSDRACPPAEHTADSDELSPDHGPDSQHTIRPSRVSSGYEYGYGAPPSVEDLGADSAGAAVRGDSARGRRVAHQYDQSTIRANSGSGLSRAMARPNPMIQPQLQRHGARPSTTTIPVSVNGAPDQGDTISSARWDCSLNGRRLLFLSYYPAGLQIWDCTDLGSISEVLNLPSKSVYQLIVDDSLPTNGDTPDMVIEYAGIVSQGSDEDPLLGLVVTPTDERRDSIDEASDSVLLAAEDEVSREPSDNHSWLLIYSFAEYGVVKRIRLPGLTIGGGRFEVGKDFVVVSTTLPPSLLVLSSSSFDILHHIPSSDLLPFCHKPASSSGLSTSHLSSRPHSFLETTSNIVNGIYNNYNDHFHDNYHNNINRISERNNNVLLPTVDHFSSSSSGAIGDYPGGHHIRPNLQGQASQATELPSTAIPETIPQPAPIFSVSGRLLAYASLPEGNSSPSLTGVQPRTSSTLSSAAVSTASAFRSALSAQLVNLGNAGDASSALGALGGISQADVGNAALKVGGSMLSGMKSLGGLAYKSAVSAATDSGSGASVNRRVSGGGGGVGGLANRFFSRSAPAATSSNHEERERRYSMSSNGSMGIEGYEAGKTVSIGQDSETDSNRRLSVPPRTVPAIETGYGVTVLDLAKMLNLPTSMKRSNDNSAVITQFIASKSQPVSNIWFSASGTSLLIAPRDGQSIQVHEIRSDPVLRIIGTDRQRDATFSASKTKNSVSSQSSPPPPKGTEQVYNLRRGRTPAVIESADWASDGRWLAIGTRKRTIHIFAVNPYGGPSDIQSHIDGRVKNLQELPAMPGELYPLVRLRVQKNPSPEQPKVPLAFAFLEPSNEAERRLPSNLLPPISSPHLLPLHQQSYGSVSSNHTVMSSSPSTWSEPMSPRQQLHPSGRPRNFQDVLVFDPTDGLLSLRRITTNVKIKSKDGTSILNASIGSVGGMNASRSLPGTNTGGRLSSSASPGTSPPQRMTVVGHPPVVEGISELIGKDDIVASWILRRGNDWSEKKGTLESLARKGVVGSTASPTNWLAQAELSTFSKSNRVLPRSVYLSHQFSFRALGEDYHALIRRYQFDVAGPKIEVHKGVEVSAYPTGSSESFVEGGGFAVHHDRRRLSSSFDEPLASALAGGLDYTPSQPILPMFPNGAPGTKPRSFKNSIPIRTMTGIGDGMSEGIGRFRREINKARSPPFPPSSDASLASSVPLEFDEEDEDFLSREAAPIPESKDIRNNGLSLDGNDVPLSERPINDDQWPGWVGEDRKAVDEVETFDDISAVGFMDEEIHATKVNSSAKNRKSKKKRN
ncbi:hypothetical protein BDP27DRAFT_1323920 [Rhodocollybia butyracea]|uniref:BCAS3 WD40 domain-containing protein n=1 Tax=Rhodocollybia butyracea TaxID=206335 RepID=A0A9P5U8X2_9AGAR|nr:hypothetical protein BDP27DRAFT_1323920 [Rhodocollybia butyracea]